MLMIKMTKQKIFTLISVALVILAACMYLFHSSQQKITTQVTQINQTASSTSSNFYTLSQAERDNYLFMMNQDKDYHAVVNATNDGIQNHRELVWNDLDFWEHRGMALYELGNCVEAGAAFYHVLVRVPDDNVASAFMTNITSGKGCGIATSTSSVK
jgi:hypothetical protein